LYGYGSVDGRICPFAACRVFEFAPARTEHLPVKTYTTADGLPRDTASCISSNSHGLHGLENRQRRVRQLRVTLTIESSPGQGTRLKLTIPLKPHTI
jgi:nitrate/nitrite-specific signal transduction histidine kinase